MLVIANLHTDGFFFHNWIIYIYLNAAKTMFYGSSTWESTQNAAKQVLSIKKTQFYLCKAKD